MTRAHDLLQGTPFGTILPTRPEVQTHVEGGRMVALRILKDYISELTFFRLNNAATGSAIPFKIDARNIHIEQTSREDYAPISIVFLPGPFEYEGIGLNAYIDEDTKDVYGRGTAVQENCVYKEQLQIEIWCEEGPQRSALISGLERWLSPTEQYAGLRFQMPDYYGRTCCFSLNRGERGDIPDTAVKNRRVAVLSVSLDFNVASLVNVVEIDVRQAVFVDDEAIDV
jgi:hypothetical protein